jgi:type IV secretory pathway TrbD component
LVNLFACIVFKDGLFVTGLGLGGLERWIAYPVVLWLMGLGGYLLGARDDVSC